MQLLRVEDCGNCKTSVERICQVRVGWECCRYLLNVRLPTLVLGLLTQFTGDNKNNDVSKHILPVGMLVSWYPDTHIYHLNESVKWQVRWNKIALAVVLEIVCGAWLLAEKFKKWKSNPFLNGGDIERQSSSELSFTSSVNMFDYKCWKCVNILGFSVALHQILNWHWYWIFICWRFSFWDMEFCVECVGRSCTWVKLEQMATKFQNGCLLKLFIIFRGQLVTASLVV